MNPRIKKLAGGAALVVVLILWVGAAVTIADALPDFWLAKLVYFIIAGIGWALPAMPLISWMNAEPVKKREP